MVISFIIVNYASEKFLQRCVASIVKHAPTAIYEIILVNNDRQPLANIAGAKIIQTDANGGFAKACNEGARAAVGKILFFLNPDTEITTSNLDGIVSALAAPTIGIVAPRLVTPAGNVQPWSVGYEINLLTTLGNNLGHVKSRRLWTSAFSGEVDWTSGAALAISKDLFQQYGGFDEKFFMYFEDVDLCRRVRSLGKKIMLLSDIKIMHLGGQSISDIKKQKHDYYQSQDYYFQKHFSPLSAFLLKFLRKTFLLLS